MNFCIEIETNFPMFINNIFPNLTVLGGGQGQGMILTMTILKIGDTGIVMIITREQGVPVMIMIGTTHTGGVI